jgi:DNA polymerase epsilon subunit 1
VAHPEWLHKRLLEKTDVLKQRKINEIFSSAPKPIQKSPEEEDNEVGDIEEIGGGNVRPARSMVVVTSVRNRGKRGRSPELDLTKHWKDVFGPAPPQGDDAKTIAEWLIFHKKKWAYQSKQRSERVKKARLIGDTNDFGLGTSMTRKNQGPATLGGFLRQAQQTLINSPWQVIQVVETNQPGLFKVWALVGTELHQLKVTVPRIFYLNSKEAKPNGDGEHFRKCNRTLPRSHHTYNLYEYSIPEELYKATSK